MVEDIKNIVDHGAALSVLAVLAEWLPVAVSALAFIWYAIRIYDRFFSKKTDVE
jgi:hypothetical protein